MEYMFMRIDSPKSHNLVAFSVRSIYLDQRNLRMLAHSFFNLILVCVYSADRITSISVQLNEFIDAFPTNYFVKVYFEEIISENLGPSNVPVTLLLKKEIGHNQSRSIPWCRFFPVSSFIGVRSEKTVNLIFINITKCYISIDSTSHHCKFLSLASGIAFDGPGSRTCEVEVDQAYTLVLAENINKDIISNDIKGFWSKFNSAHFPHYILLFYSRAKPFCTDICDFKFSENEISINCVKVNTFSTSVLRNKPAPPGRWQAGLRIDYSPKQNSSDNSALWELYNNQPTEEFLITEILRKANESARYTYPAPKSGVSKHVEWEETTLRGQHVLVDNTETGFLSCYSTPKLKFQMYLQPFHLEVWIALVLCCSSITVIIGLYNRQFNISQSFSPFFFFFSTLLEEPYSVPSKLWNSRVFKSFTATWLLTAMLFTNLYIGLMITDVVAPLKGDVLKTFNQFLLKDVDLFKQDLVSLTYEILKFWKFNYTQSSRGSHMGIPSIDEKVCDVQFNSKDFAYHHSQFHGANTFALLQSPLRTCAGSKPSIEIQKQLISNPWMYTGFSYLWDQINTYLASETNLVTAKLTIAFLSGSKRHYPNDPKFVMPGDQDIPLYLDAAIEKEIVDCKQSVFIGNKDDLRYELDYLRTYYPKAGLYLSNDTFEKGDLKPNLWVFDNAGKSAVPYYFKQLIEAGVRQLIIGLRKHSFYLMRRKGSKFVQLSHSTESHLGTTGSIQTIFIIWFAFCLLATFAFIFELFPTVCRSFNGMIPNKTSISRCLKNSKLKLLACNFAKNFQLSALSFIRTVLKRVPTYQHK
jgi:hypothetical protein